MVLPETLRELEELYVTLIDTIFDKEGLPDNFSQLEKRLGDIISDTTLSRLYNSEHRKDAARAEKRLKDYRRLIPLLNALLTEDSAQPSPNFFSSQPSASRTLLIYYWDWNTQRDNHTKGQVVQGSLTLPANWQNGEAIVILNDQTTLKGSIWPKPSAVSGFDISVTVSGQDQPDLFVLFHVPQKLAMCHIDLEQSKALDEIEYGAELSLKNDSTITQDSSDSNEFDDEVLAGSFVTTNMGAKHIPLPMQRHGLSAYVSKTHYG